MNRPLERRHSCRREPGQAAATRKSPLRGSWFVGRSKRNKGLPMPHPKQPDRHWVQAGNKVDKEWRLTSNSRQVMKPLLDSLPLVASGRRRSGLRRSCRPAQSWCSYPPSDLAVTDQPQAQTRSLPMNRPRTCLAAPPPHPASFAGQRDSFGFRPFQTPNQRQAHVARARFSSPRVLAQPFRLAAGPAATALLVQGFAAALLRAPRRSHLV